MAGNDFWPQRAKDIVGVSSENPDGPFLASFAGCYSTSGENWGQFAINGAKIKEIPKQQLVALANGLARNPVEAPGKVEKSENEKFMKIVDVDDGDVKYAVYRGLGELTQCGLTAALTSISGGHKALIVGCYEDKMEGRACNNRVVLISKFIFDSYKQ